MTGRLFVGFNGMLFVAREAAFPLFDDVAAAGRTAEPDPVLAPEADRSSGENVNSSQSRGRR